ncbi:MAG TPA: YihY/virulence factor BrkB family protein [Holophagaceae bacterium]|nr:YihY/virulence factor BrkB family protein [Holophagaceae bacterium]
MVEQVLTRWGQLRDQAQRRWRVFERAFPRLGAVGRFAWEVLRKFQVDDCASYAASLTFWLLISLVPLTTLLFKVLGLVLGSKAYGKPLLTGLFEIFPFLPVDFVRDVMKDSQRVGGLGLSWAVLLFGSLWGVNQLDRSLAHIFGIRLKKHRQTRRLIWVRRLSLVLGGLLFLVLVLGLMVGGILGVKLQIPRVALLGFFVPVLGVLVVTMVLQHLPRCHVAFRHALLGALVSTTLWWAAQWGFGIYLAHTQTWGIMYGSLIKIIAGLIFLYYSCGIFLLGAEITAAFYRHETTGVHVLPNLLKK